MSDADEMNAPWFPDGPFIMGNLLEFFQNDEAEEWMLSKQEMLGGERPIDLILEGRSEEVYRLIDQLRDGVCN